MTTYTPMNGFIKIGDISTDEKTITGKCLEAKGTKVKVDDIVYFPKGNETILRVDGEEMIFVDEKYVVVVKK
jgi:co-chaperonin GroES (HSP10)